MWDLAGIQENRSLRKGMRRIGGGMVSVDGHHIWSNSSIALDRIGYEKERRSWRNQHDCMPTKTKSWRRAIEGAMEDQAAHREMDDFEINVVQPCRMYLRDGEIDYMDHNGEFWDEVSRKKLDDA